MSNKIAWNYSKNHLNTIFCFHKFFNKFLWIYKDGKPRQQEKKYERKYLENLGNHQILRVKKSFRIRKIFYGVSR